MKLYIASSWRNAHQPAVVKALEKDHFVYDFRNPKADDHGFHWSEIDPNWQSWTPQQYREALKHPLAEAGHRSDSEAMRWCDVCVLVLPAGRSASFELGWCMGAGKRGAIYIPEPVEPELMFRGAEIVTSLEELGKLLWTWEMSSPR